MRRHPTRQTCAEVTANNAGFSIVPEEKNLRPKFYPFMFLKIILRLNNAYRSKAFEVTNFLSKHWQHERQEKNSLAGRITVRYGDTDSPYSSCR